MANKYVYSGAAGAGTGADWANAYTTLAAALTGSAAGDDIWVADDHAETQASAMTLTFPGTTASPCRIMCARRSGGSVPPVAADLRTTATVTTTGANAMTMAHVATGANYIYGITFSCGTGATAAVLNVFTSTQEIAATLEACALRNGTANSGGTITLCGSFTGSMRLLLNNTTVQFGHVGAAIRVDGGYIRWINTVSAITGATIPTTLFTSAGPRMSRIDLEGVDLSAAGSGKTIIGATLTACIVTVKDCKLDAAVTLSATQTAAGPDVIFTRSASSGISYTFSKYSYGGQQDTVTGVRRNGGATDGTQGVGWKIVTNSSAKFLIPYRVQRIAVFNSTTGANVTATLHGIANTSAIPTNAEVWARFAYLGSASSPLATIVSTGPATVLTTAANLTATTEDWDDGAGARANSNAYSVGDVIKVASNPGRLFFCTASTGNSAASEPAGYATAVDGDSITDGSTTFRAGWRFKVAATFSAPQPQLAGAIFAELFVGKASSTIYVDPKIVLS